LVWHAERSAWRLSARGATGRKSCDWFDNSCCLKSGRTAGAKSPPLDRVCWGVNIIAIDAMMQVLIGALLVLHLERYRARKKAIILSNLFVMPFVPCNENRPR
jgi:hypothetical protein